MRSWTDRDRKELLPKAARLPFRVLLALSRDLGIRFASETGLTPDDLLNVLDEADPDELRLRLTQLEGFA